ncbi:MAG TPA: 3'-5' exonuclease, partial [Planctomycetota bacterium]|nr:3'-5' exonuclease [Planctomycetota bacterium]
LAEQFRHVMVDEYQDTNVAQYRSIRRLTETPRNLCVTGDPAQAIYGWRGADLNNILDFERDYPGAKTVRLERNYRSTKTILAAAHDLIVHNVLRKEKTLVTENPAGSRVGLIEAVDEIAEAQELAAAVRSLLSGGMQPHDVAVFYRVNALSRTLEQSFIHAKIPYRIVAGTAFFERREVRDLVAYLRLVANPADDLACERVVNVPLRGFGKTSLDRVKAFAAEQKIALLDALARHDEIGALKPAGRESAGAFVELITGLRAGESAGPAAVLRDLLERTKYLRTFGASDEDQERVRNVGELVNDAASYEEKAEEPTLTGFLEEVALVSDQDALDDKSPTVSLMTLHAAKGLEFPAVFIVGLEEGLLPHSRSQESDVELEEERRLLFVGMTRAKRELTLSYALRRRQFGEFADTEPSRFLAEISPERFREASATAAPATASAAARGASPPSPAGTTASLKPGDTVRSPSFGVGTVLSVTGLGDKLKAVVKFDAVGTKTLMVVYAKLERLKAEG